MLLPIYLVCVVLAVVRGQDPTSIPTSYPSPSPTSIPTSAPTSVPTRSPLAYQANVTVVVSSSTNFESQWSVCADIASWTYSSGAYDCIVEVPYNGGTVYEVENVLDTLTFPSVSMDTRISISILGVVGSNNALPVLRGGYYNFLELIKPSGFNFTFNIENVELTGSIGGQSAIHMQDVDGFTMNNSVISNCSGAVYFDSAEGALQVTNSQLLSNDANTNAATGAGGGIFVNGDNEGILIENVVFNGNVATKGGGLYFGSDCTYTVIKNCEFVGNIAYLSGGGVYLGDDNTFATILSSNFTNNRVNTTNTDASGAGNGGGVYVGARNDNLHIYECVFDLNGGSDIDGNGGAIYMSTTDGSDSVHIDGSIFTSNRMDNGGAVYVGGTENNAMQISNSIFRSNSAFNAGGGVSIATDSGWNSTIKNVTFESNYADGGGGALYSQGGTSNVNISNCRVVTNSVDSNGGGIMVDGTDGSNWVFDNCIFAGNSANSGSGGAVYVSGNTYQGSFNGCEFLDNMAGVNGASIGLGTGCQYWSVTYCVFRRNQGNFGGGVFVTGTTSIAVSYNEFSDNRALMGAGVFIKDSNSQISVSDCYFGNNTALPLGGSLQGGAGGGLFVNDGNSGIALTNLVFEGNVAYSDGGGVYIHDSNENMYLNNLNFTSNNATGGVRYASGGGLYLHDNNVYLSMTNIHFINNFGAEFGGGAYIHDNNYLVLLQNTWFAGNVASKFHGGGLYFNAGNSNIQVSSSEFDGNSAGNLGGAIYLSFINYEMGFTDSTFNRNHAYTSGGAMYMEGCSSIAITDCVYYNNFASTSSGGALFLTKIDSVRISSSTFTNSTASHGGGAIFVGQQSFDIAIVGVDFDENRAVDGGALYIDRSNANIGLSGDSTCTNNYASDSGGCVFISSSNDAISLDSTTFDNNTAVYDGGSIFADQYNEGISVDSCVFLNGTAENGGAIFSKTYNSWDISGSSFVGNMLKSVYGADANGGALYMGTYHDAIDVGNSRFEENGISYCNMTNITAPNAAPSTCLSGLVMYSCGAIYVGASSGPVSITGSVFNKNNALGSGGVCFDNAEDVTVDSSRFYSNRQISVAASGADVGGGALNFLKVTGNIEVSNNVFEENYAAVKGSAIYSKQTYTVMSNNNQFIGNVVDSYGGTLFWTFVPDSSGYDSPNILSTGDVFLNNTAQYGTELATQGIALNGSQSSFNIDTYDAFVHTTVTVVDYYGNAVTGIVGGVAKLQLRVEVVVFTEYVGCADFASGVASGEVSVVTTTGVATFDAFQLNCIPEGNLILVYYLGSSSDPDAALDGSIIGYVNTSHYSTINEYTMVTFRACVPGEYYSNGQCIVCPIGTYSLQLDPANYQQTVCLPAPANSNSSNTFGNSIYVLEGYWRVSDMAYTLIACPYGKVACRAGVTAGDNSCGVGYEGALCGVCSEDYFFDAATSTCASCQGQVSISVLYLGLMVIGGVVFIVLVSTRFESSVLLETDAAALLEVIKARNSQVKDDLESGNESVNSEAQLASAMVPHDGEATEANLNGYDKDMAAPGCDDITDTGSKGEEVQYGLADSLMAKGKILISVYQIVSSFPALLNIQYPPFAMKMLNALGFSNILNINISGLSCGSSHAYDYLDTLIVSTVGPFIVVAIMWTLYCIDVLFVKCFWKKYRSSGELNEQGIKRIATLTSRYAVLFFLFTYALLTSVSSTIAAAYACTNIDPDNVLPPGSETMYLTADLSVSCSSERYRLGVLWATVMVFVYPLGIPALYYYLLTLNLDDIRKVTVLDDGKGGEVVEVTRPTEADYEARGCSSNFVSYKDLSFLYTAYEPKFWYWEIVETMRRLFFTALLVFPATPNLQVVGAIMMSVVFMKLYGYYAPYEQDADDVLQETAQYQVFFTLFSGLVIRTNALAGIPSINIILSVFIVVVNSVATLISPYLIYLENYESMVQALHKYLPFLFLSSAAAKANGSSQFVCVDDSDSDDGIEMGGALKKDYSIPAQITSYDSDDSVETDQHDLKYVEVQIKKPSTTGGKIPIKSTLKKGVA